jgi:hypothetical protein
MSILTINSWYILYSKFDKLYSFQEGGGDQNDKMRKKAKGNEVRRENLRR